jgi:hypothetical protein
MLSLNPSKRFNVSDVLSHAWLKATMPSMSIVDDRENVCVEPPKPLASRKWPEYRHVAFAPVGAEVVGLGLQMSMELWDVRCGSRRTLDRLSRGERVRRAGVPMLSKRHPRGSDAHRRTVDGRGGGPAVASPSPEAFPWPTWTCPLLALSNY